MAEGGHEDDLIGDVEIRIARRQALSLVFDQAGIAI